MKPWKQFWATPPRPKRNAAISRKPPADTAVVLLSASGKIFMQEMAQRFAGLRRIVLLCGRYEGVDERVAEHLATDEVSIGDFVLSGGELAAALVIDAVTRLLPGALGNEASSVHESFSSFPSCRDSRGSAGKHKRNPKIVWLTAPRARPYCSTARITRGPRNSAAGRCRTCC